MSSIGFMSTGRAYWTQQLDYRFRVTEDLLEQMRFRKIGSQAVSTDQLDLWIGVRCKEHDQEIYDTASRSSEFSESQWVCILANKYGRTGNRIQVV
jgi:hypothetical protein